MAPSAPVCARISASLTFHLHPISQETVSDLEALAADLNPTLKFWDPLNLSGMDMWGKGEEATVGWLRHAEIKHGRVAMAAFVGYCLQANGAHFPWGLTDSVSFGDISAAGYPNEQWDALPTLAKLQIIAAIGLLEYFGESDFALGNSGEKHYMKGGTPGFYPSLKSAGVPHPVPLDLWDPFGFTKGMSAEKKAKSLKAEINNGRLAMIGIMSLMCAAKGAIVGPLDGLIPAYGGEPMAPFAAGDVKLPMVAEMLKAFDGASFAGY